MINTNSLLIQHTLKADSIELNYDYDFINEVRYFLDVLCPSVSLI